MKKATEENKNPQKEGERIAKVMARAGLCSRREAERWIQEGRVQLNGEVLKSPAVTVTSADEIFVDNTPLQAAERTRVWRYHKIAGLVTTHRDEKGRQTVFETLPASLPRVISVGRLDLNTEGLLLLTNDGELARLLEHPDNQWKRRYRVRAFGQVDEKKLASLASGIVVEGVKYGSIEASLEKTQGGNSWLQVSLSEGKNREIKKVMEAIGLQVNRLIRTSYGPFQLGNLGKNEIDEITGKILKEQIPHFFK